MNTQITEIILKSTQVTGIVLAKEVATIDAFVGLAMTASLVTKCKYQQVIFSECNFNCTEFQGVIFDNCVFENCTFEFSHFRNCQFNNCNFNECHWIASTVQKSLFENSVLDAHLTKQLSTNENIDLSGDTNSFEIPSLSLVAA